MGWLCPSVFLSVHMIQLENYLTEKNEIWYECCAKGDYLPNVPSSILRSVVTE
jgi:hypothetical protein